MKKGNKSPRVMSEEEQKLRALLSELAGTDEQARSLIDPSVRRLIFASINQYERPMHQIKGKAEVRDTIKQIGSHSAAIAKLIENAPANLRWAFPSHRALLDLQETAESVLEDVPIALDRVDSVPVRRGKPVKLYERQVELAASKVYKLFTRKDAKFTLDPDTSKPSGHYFRFASEVLRTLGIKANLLHMIRLRLKQSRRVHAD